MTLPNSSQTRPGDRRWFVGGEYEEVEDPRTGEIYRVPIPVDYGELVEEGVKLAGIFERFGGHVQIAAHRVEVADDVFITHGVAFQLFSYSPGKRRVKAEQNGKPPESPSPEPEPDPEPEPVVEE